MKIILGIMLGVMLIGLASASDYLPQKQNTDFDLVITSNNATTCNWTYIQYPNGSKVSNDFVMTQSGRDFSQLITLGNFTALGSTCMGVTCFDGATYESGSVCREVTFGGDIMSGAGSSFYIISIAVLFILFLLCIWATRGLPSGDAMDEEGTILQVSYIKHLRPVLYGVAWGILLAIIFVTSNMTLAYAGNPMLGNFFFVAYQVMFWLTIVAVPLWMIWIFTGIFRDVEFKRMIERGVELKGGL